MSVESRARQERRRALREALALKREDQYHRDATFHYLIDGLADALLFMIDGLASGTAQQEVERQQQIEALRAYGVPDYRGESGHDFTEGGRPGGSLHL